MKKFTVFVFSLFATALHAQELVFEKPAKMGSQVNTTAEEISPMLSSDGKTFYFVRAFYSKNTGGQYAGSDIWVSKKNGNTSWQTATNNFEKLNNNSNNSVIGISKNNSALYLSDGYTKKRGISKSSRIVDSWGTPAKIPLPGIITSDFVGYYVSPEEDVLFISMKDDDSAGQEDIYVSLKDSLGTWSLPVSVGTSINTDGFEISPFLSQDKKKLYFASNGHDGLGDADIYVSERLYDSWTVWTKPRNLGPVINSDKFDAYFTLFGDSVAYFASNRDSDMADLFEVKVSIKKEETFAEQFNFLTDEQIAKLTTRKFDNLLIYPVTATTLSDKQKTQLIPLVNILKNNKDLKARLLVTSTTQQNDRERYQQRLLAILDYLKVNEIEGARISFGSEKDDSTKKPAGETVSIKIYR